MAKKPAKKKAAPKKAKKTPEVVIEEETPEVVVEKQSEEEKPRYTCIEDFFANEMALPHETYLYNCGARRVTEVTAAWHLYRRNNT